ncbi:MAG: response regulator [Myxococcales bacterium]|nr:response regulator [Myxococcales bacterium]
MLLVEDAPFMLEALSRILLPHFTKIVTAMSYASALRELESDAAIEVILSDVVLPDGNGFKLLEKISGAPPPRPKVILTTARWTEKDRQRAQELGAVGYLRKPIAVRDLRAVLTGPSAPTERAPRLRTLARVWVIEPEKRERLLCFDIHDISKTGVLLDTPGPLPVGAEIEFEIVRREGESIRGRGKIVRVQEPNWLNAAGSALHFSWLESKAKLEKLIEEDGAIVPDVLLREASGAKPSSSSA